MARRKKRARRARCAWWAMLQAFAATDLEERGQVLDLSPEEILAWADAYQARTGQWPNKGARPTPESPGETWETVRRALSGGRRGLPAGTSLSQLWQQHSQHRLNGTGEW